MTLNLGAGNRVKTDPGAINLDRTKHRPEIDVAHDLNVLPWPFADESFDKVLAIAVLEHLKLNLVESLDECWRLLRPGGTLYVKLPHWKADNSYIDPTHYWQFSLRSLEVFDPATEFGKRYAFYTARKWQIVKGARAQQGEDQLRGDAEGAEMSKGIALIGADKTIQAQANSHRLAVTVVDAPQVAYDKTLIVEPGTRVPWDLLPAAWHFLNKWDAAVPLWKYGKTAADMGTAADREATRAVIRDLRVLLYSHELLFVRGSEDGCALVETWLQETQAGGDKRLAFLRALYHVKPMVCVLPTTWLAEVRAKSQQAALGTRGRSPNAGKPLVTVELGPGRFVKCHAGDEDRVREQFEKQRGRG